jgi:hypothetical protein
LQEDSLWKVIKDGMWKGNKDGMWKVIITHWYNNIGLILATSHPALSPLQAHSL